MIVMNDASSEANIFLNILMPIILMNKASSNTCIFSFLFCGVFYDNVKISGFKDSVAGRKIGGQ
jgi:hypothetical protein